MKLENEKYLTSRKGLARSDMNREGIGVTNCIVYRLSSFEPKSNHKDDCRRHFNDNSDSVFCRTSFNTIPFIYGKVALRALQIKG